MSIAYVAIGFTLKGVKPDVVFSPYRLDILEIILTLLINTMSCFLRRVNVVLVKLHLSDKNGGGIKYNREGETQKRGELYSGVTGS